MGGSRGDLPIGADCGCPTDVCGYWIENTSTPVAGEVEIISGHCVSRTNRNDVVVLRLVREDGREVHLPLCPDLARGVGHALVVWAETRTVPKGGEA